MNAHKLLSLSLSATLLLVACGDDDDTDTTNGTTPGTTDASTSGDPSSSTTMTSTTMTSNTTTDATESSSSDPTTPDSSGSGSESGTGGDVCMIEADDDACAMCTKTSCCDQLDMCYADADCQCTVLCVQMYLADNPGSDTNAGLMYCTMDNEDGPAPCMLGGAAAGLAIALNGCVSGMCAADCGGA